MGIAISLEYRQRLFRGNEARNSTIDVREITMLRRFVPAVARLQFAGRRENSEEKDGMPVAIACTKWEVRHRVYYLEDE